MPAKWRVFVGPGDVWAQVEVVVEKGSARTDNLACVVQQSEQRLQLLVGAHRLVIPSPT